MRKDDRVRIQHMLDAANEAMGSVQSSTRADLDDNHMWVLGLVKCVEIIGEAAARVTAETRDQYPKIPWGLIIGMRNRLVHVYFDVDLDQVWSTVTEDVPILAQELERILSMGCKGE